MAVSLTSLNALVLHQQHVQHQRGPETPSLLLHQILDEIDESVQCYTRGDPKHEVVRKWSSFGPIFGGARR